MSNYVSKAQRAQKVGWRKIENFDAKNLAYQVRRIVREDKYENNLGVFVEKKRRFLFFIPLWCKWLAQSPLKALISVRCWVGVLIKIKYKPINLTFHSSWTIEQIEQYVEKMFQLGLFDYYEKWE